MDTHDFAARPLTRRRLLRDGTVLLTALAGGMLATAPARADDLLSKASVHYQTQPHAGQHCSDCAYFIPGASATALGQCRLVAGRIDPMGWCERFSS